MFQPQAEIMNRTGFIFWILICPVLAFSQPVIDANAFFEAALSLQEPEEASATKGRYFPWVETFDLRTETRDFDFGQQEYTFRLSPSSPGKRKAQRALYDHLNKGHQLEVQENNCDRLSRIYADWLNLYLIRGRMDILDKQAEILTDKQRIYEKMAGAYDFEFRKIIQLHTDRSDVAIEQNELQLEQAFLCEQYLLGECVFDFSDFIPIDRVLDWLEAEAPARNRMTHPGIAYEKEWIQKELALEKAKNRQLFDFVQLRYVGPHENLLSERVHLGIAFRIPNSGARKLKMHELQLQGYESDMEARQYQFETSAAQQQLRLRIRDYEFYMQTVRQERTQLEQLGDKISRQEGFDPFLLLEIEERQLETREKALRKKEMILLDYLDYLEDTGQMCEMPFVNYLTTD